MGYIVMALYSYGLCGYGLYGGPVYSYGRVYLWPTEGLYSHGLHGTYIVMTYIAIAVHSYGLYGAFIVMAYTGPI